MAAPTVRAVGAIASGVGAISPGLPAGTAAGDLLVMVLETNWNQAITVSGWTACPSSPQAHATNIGIEATRLSMFYKIAAGGDATTTSDSGDHQHGCIIGITAGTFDATTPFNANAGNVTTTRAAVVIPGVTTSVADCLILAVTCTGVDSAGTTLYSSWTNANLTGITERVDSGVTDGSGGRIGACTGVKATAGATGNTTVTMPDEPKYTAQICLAIAPASATEHFGASSLTATLTATTTGTRTTFGVVSLAETVGVTTVGMLEAFGASSSALTFAATTVGRLTAFSSSSLVVTLTATTAGARTQFGASSLAVTFSGTTAGTRTTFGVTTLAETLGVTTAGTLGAFGASSATTTFGATTAGTRTTFGATSLAETLTITTAGSTTVIHSGATSLLIVLSKNTQGTRTTFGVASLTITLLANTQFQYPDLSVSIPALEAWARRKSPGPEPTPFASPAMWN